ncbi:MAG: peptidylprolyl isomerase [Candidatus Omnitrophota bacterium]
MNRTPTMMVAVLLFATIVVNDCMASEADIIGEAFGKPVTEKEFGYYLRTAQIFTRQGKDEKAQGGQQRDEEQLRLEAWQNLIYVTDAKVLGIVASEEETKQELQRLLSDKNMEYGSSDYKAMVTLQFGESPEVFERRVQDLVSVNKLLDIKNNPEVTVTDEDMYQKFLDEYNSFESEYIWFATKEAAEEFFEKVKKTPKLWYDTYNEKAKEGQKGATWINSMSLIALIDLWKIPREDAYRIHAGKRGDFIVARFYYGDAVFRLLDKKEADTKEYNDKKKEYYKESMTRSQKYRISKAYFDDLAERAKYRDYVAEKKFQEKKGQLKEKAKIVLETNQGKIGVKLFVDIAPLACENFIKLVEKGYYNGIIFHRVIKDFMIQTGDPTGAGTGGDSIWGVPFVNEVSEDVLFDKPGLLAMANSGADTNKSQFFITVKPTTWLNKKHTIFGEVVEGYTVVEKIANTPTDPSNDKPKEEQKIIKAYVGEIKGGGE